jgi:hypothetical protein
MEQCTGRTTPEAFAEVVEDAVARLPEGATVVGIAVTLAYVTPQMPRNAVEACGACVSRSGVPADDIARLFAVYAQARASGWQPHPEPAENGARALLRQPRPRRRPRR